MTGRCSCCLLKGHKNTPLSFLGQRGFPDSCFIFLWIFCPIFFQVKGVYLSIWSLYFSFIGSREYSGRLKNGPAKRALVLILSCNFFLFCYVLILFCNFCLFWQEVSWDLWTWCVYSHPTDWRCVPTPCFTLDELFLACLTGEVEPFFSAVGACPWPLGKQNICKSCVHGGLLNVGWALSLFPTDFHFVTLSWGLSQMQVKFQGLGTSYLGIILFCSWFWNQVTMDFAFLLIERKGRVKRKPT